MRKAVVGVTIAVAISLIYAMAVWRAPVVDLFTPIAKLDRQPISQPSVSNV